LSSKRFCDLLSTDGFHSFCFKNKCSTGILIVILRAGALLRAHLADHQSTEAELQALMHHFREAAAVVMAQPGAERRVVLARSEMYTTRRQAADIRAQTLAVLATL
jgi:hypothetical protein